MTRFNFRTFMFIPALFAFALSGCEERSPVQPPAAAPTPAPAEVPTPEPPPLPSAPPAAARIDAPIDPARIATRIEMAEPPEYVRAADTLVLRVRVHNDGSHLLVSAGEKMVQLGAMLIGPQGIDSAPGKRDFVRAQLPLLQPGTNTQVQIELPVNALLELPVRLELVQEGVNWFGRYGEPSLDLGPYTRCTDDAAALCDAAGTAVASR